MEEEKKSKKKIGSNYGILVILLFATVAFLTDYIIIESKIRVCECPKCETINNEVISDNTDNTQVTENKTYSYEDIAGVYKTSKSRAEDVCTYKLVLSSDGLFRYAYGCGWGIVHYGNYYINNNKIYLNDVFQTGSDPSVVIQNDIIELEIGKDKTIIDNVSMAKESTNVDAINLILSDEKYNIRDDYQYLLQDKVVNLMNAASENCNND